MITLAHSEQPPCGLCRAHMADDDLSNGHCPACQARICMLCGAMWAAAPHHAESELCPPCHKSKVAERFRVERERTQVLESLLRGDRRLAIKLRPEPSAPASAYGPGMAEVMRDGPCWQVDASSPSRSERARDLGLLLGGIERALLSPEATEVYDVEEDDEGREIGMRWYPWGTAPMLCCYGVPTRLRIKLAQTLRPPIGRLMAVHLLGEDALRRARSRMPMTPIRLALQSPYVEEWWIYRTREDVASMGSADADVHIIGTDGDIPAPWSEEERGEDDAISVVPSPIWAELVETSDAMRDWCGMTFPVEGIEYRIVMDLPEWDPEWLILSAHDYQIKVLGSVGAAPPSPPPAAHPPPAAAPAASPGPAPFLTLIRELPDWYTPRKYGCSDADNATRIERQAGHLFRTIGEELVVYDASEGRYVPQGKTLVQGARIAEVILGRIETFEATPACDAAHQAEVLAEEDPTDENQRAAKAARAWAKEITAHARASQNEPRIRAAVQVLARRESLKTTWAQFDARPQDLVVQNGILDLATGILRPHSPDELVTHRAPIRWRPEAECPEWEEFVRGICRETEDADDYDHDYYDYIQMVLGYCTSGDIRQRIALVLHGQSNSGKSLLAGTIQGVLGLVRDGYTTSITPKALTESRDNQINAGQESALALCVHARLVVASESAKSHKLDAATLKRLISGDVIPTKFMGRDFFNFIPQFKMLILLNEFFQLPAEDGAVWNRMRVLPFRWVARTLDRDKQARMIAREGEGILRWLQQGYEQYLRATDGGTRDLPTPEIVRAATQRWRDEEDHAGLFVQEQYVVDRTAKPPITRDSLNEEYERWHRQRYGAPPSGRVGVDLAAAVYRAWEQAGINPEEIKALKKKSASSRNWSCLRRRQPSDGEGEEKKRHEQQEFGLN